MSERAGSKLLVEFVSNLKRRNRLPKNIELTMVGNVHMASIYNTLASDVIAENVYTGMDHRSDVAVLKGLVEMIERQAYSKGHANGIDSCLTERSDGFAAFPRGVITNYKESARENAYHEAVERFCWATWWDDPEIAHTLKDVHLSKSSQSVRSLLFELSNIVSVNSVRRVCPTVEKPGLTLVIYFAHLNPTGVISGGACGPTSQIETVEFRAICELIRHGLGIMKIRKDKLLPRTFYERRLNFFGNTLEGTELVTERLTSAGLQSISLPAFLIDSVVPHDLADLVTVHRCLFENQPPFVGGALERLCL